MDKLERTPRHAQLATELRRRIVEGHYAVGEPLPSESSLTAEFAVSRGTLRQALAALRAEQLIGGGRGRSPVVRRAVATQPFDTLLSFTAWAWQTGRTPGQRTVELARRGVSREAADALQLEEGEPAVTVLRLRLLDGVPAMVERSTFPLDIGRHLFDVDTDSCSIYASLAAAGVDLHGAVHTIDAVVADDVDAELLGVESGSALLRERRVAFSSEDEPLEWADDRYLPGLVAFRVRNVREPAAGRTWGRDAPVRVLHPLRAAGNLP